jgi:hypothetical protein
MQLGIAGMAALVCGGLLIWAVSWLWPLRPAAIVLIGAGYEDNLAFPANVCGLDGLHELAQPGRRQVVGRLCRRQGRAAKQTKQ